MRSLSYTFRGKSKGLPPSQFRKPSTATVRPVRAWPPSIRRAGWTRICMTPSRAIISAPSNVPPAQDDLESGGVNCITLHAPAVPAQRWWVQSAGPCMIGHCAAPQPALRARERGPRPCEWRPSKAHCTRLCIPRCVILECLRRHGATAWALPKGKPTGTSAGGNGPLHRATWRQSDPAQPQCKRCTVCC